MEVLEAMDGSFLAMSEAEVSGLESSFLTVDDQVDVSYVKSNPNSF